jgi:hypothetical protein
VELFVRLLLPVFIFEMVLVVGCRSTNLRGDLSSLTDLTASTSEISVLALISELHGAQDNKIRFFMVADTQLLVYDKPSSTVAVYDVTGQLGKILNLGHPQSGKNWFVQLSLPANEHSLEVNGVTTLSQDAAVNDGQVSRPLLPLPGLSTELRNILVGKILHELELLRYDFSPYTARAIVTHLRKLGRELPRDDSSSLALRDALLETAAFIKRNESLYPLPVVEIWTDNEGKVQVATLAKLDRIYLQGWPVSAKGQGQFRLVGNELVQIDSKIFDLDGVSAAGDALNLGCDSKSLSLKAGDAHARFELAQQLHLGSVKVKFFDGAQAQWYPTEVYKLADDGSYIVLETPGSAYKFGVEAGRVALGNKMLSGMEHHSVLSFYRVDLGAKAYAAELDNHQTLLIKEEGQSAELVYWNGQAIVTRKAERISLKDFYAVTASTPPAPPSWCKVISSL